MLRCYRFAFEIQDSTYLWFSCFVLSVFIEAHPTIAMTPKTLYLSSKTSDTFTSLSYLSQDHDANCANLFTVVRTFNMSRDNCVIYDENTPL